MPIETRAAVLHAPNTPMTIETLTLEGPGPGEVLIEIKATGLCHSDLHIMKGSLPGVFPSVLGHEAGAVVVECGANVTGLKPGDHVIPLFCPECGECPQCRSGKTNICMHFATGTQQPKLFLDGKPIHQTGGLGTFSNYTVVKALALAKIRKDAPLDRAFYIGCGVTTGVGAVLFTARVEAGTSVVVFGVGGIGLNVLQGARMAGAGMIVAVDTNSAREAIARKFGATHFVNPKELGKDLVSHLFALTQGGADYSFECVGNTDLMRQAFDCTNTFWGVSTVVGAAPHGQDAAIGPFSLLLGRRWQGTMFGGAKGRTDVPKVVDWYMDGTINIDDLVTHTLRLDQINEGFELMKRGESIRSVVVF
jgi:S-(hydroxymethyl)glutathione dehydrogenase / alcohol dehydrogenase